MRAMLLAMTAVIWILQAAAAAEATVVRTFTVVEDATVWPNLTRLPGGELLLAGFNKPSHGQREGDVGCWISRDDGESWQSVGTMTEHEPHTVRMNQAVGLNRHGHVVGLVGGWSDIQQEGAQKRQPFRDAILQPWACRSEDGVKTWTVRKEFPADPAGREFIPFGDIALSQDGRLSVVAYSTSYWNKPGPWAAYFLTSEDDGASWQVGAKLDDNINETALLSLGDGEWLAVARSSLLTQYRSTDDGKSWTNEGAVSQKGQYPGHLLQLGDGRLALSFGDRSSQKGVKARLSDDNGKTWSEAVHLADMLHTDGGYPASVQRKDGSILTLFYTKSAETYVVNAVIWNAPPGEAESCP